jgi:hypothetical protein
VTAFQRLQYKKWGGGENNFTVEKLGKHYLRQVVKISINNDVMLMLCTLDRVIKMATYLCGLPPQNT